MFYTLKILFITVSLLFLLQIKVKDETLEVKAMNWVRTSSLIKPIQAAADGVVSLTYQVWHGDSKEAKEVFFDSLEKGKEGLTETIDEGKSLVGDNFSRIKDRLGEIDFFKEDNGDAGKKLK